MKNLKDLWANSVWAIKSTGCTNSYKFLLDYSYNTYNSFQLLL